MERIAVDPKAFTATTGGVGELWSLAGRVDAHGKSVSLALVYF